jgi:hypothetical protein
MSVMLEALHVDDTTHSRNSLDLALADDVNEVRTEDTNTTAIWTDKIQIGFPTLVSNEHVDRPNLLINIAAMRTRFHSCDLIAPNFFRVE